MIAKVLILAFLTMPELAVTDPTPWLDQHIETIPFEPSEDDIEHNWTAEENNAR